MYNILLIDDDKSFHFSFKSVIESDDVKTFFAANKTEAFQLIKESPFNLIFLDLDLGKEKGLEILPLLIPYKIPICILSGTVNISTTVQALKIGAVDVAEKPISKEKLLNIIKNYSANFKVEQENIWQSKAMKECYDLVLQLAKSTAKVLLRGETGTGKEVLAKDLHTHSLRKSEAFVAINCGAIPENLIESELFGYVKGAFTGADNDSKGLIKTADKGTLFLDEIADLPLLMQGKLLRFLQEQEIRAVGSNKTEKVDVRVIAATHKNLEELIKVGAFREDLYFRLNVFTIDIPPLRERIADLTILIDSLTEKFKFIYNNKITFLAETISLLEKYQWSGNIRELSNLVERLSLTAQGPIKIIDLPKNIRENLQADIIKVGLDYASLKEAREAFEKDYIEKMWKESKNLKDLSARLGIERTTLYKKLRQFGINESELS